MARETRQTTGHSTPRVFHYPNVDPGPVKAKVAKPRANTKAKRTPKKAAAGSKPTGVTKKPAAKKVAAPKKPAAKKSAGAAKGDAGVKKTVAKAKVAEQKIEKAVEEAEDKIDKAVADVTGEKKTKVCLFVWWPEYQLPCSSGYRHHDLLLTHCQAPAAKKESASTKDNGTTTANTVKK